MSRLRGGRALVVATAALALAAGAFGAAPTTRAHAAVGTATAVTLPAHAVDFQLHASHNGQANDTQLVAPLAKAWSIPFGASTRTYPLIAGGAVFVCYTSATTAEPEVVEALNLQTGSVLWGPTTLPGDRTACSMAYDDRRLFVTNFGGDLLAFDAANGTVDWSQTPINHEYDTGAAPTAYRGTLYFPGAGTVYAINEATGAIKWESNTLYSVSGSPAADSSGVYISASCRDIQRLTFTGQRVWLDRPDCPGQADQYNVLHDGAVYAHAGDVSGNRAAEVGPVVSESIGRPVGAVLSGTPPVFESDLQVGVENGRVTATNVQSGDNLWNTSDKDYALPALLVNGYAAVADTAGDVRLLNAQTGRVAWSASVHDPISPPDESNGGSPNGLAEGDGHLAVASDDALTVFAAAASPPARVVITSGPVLNTFTRGSATFGFDSDIPAATYTCSVDGRTPITCASPYRATGLSQGPHTFRVALSTDSSVTARRSFAVDRTAPTAHVTALPALTDTSSIVASWSGSDGQSAVGSFDVRDRVVGPAGKPSRWTRPVALQHDILAAARLPVEPGTSLCLSVRARDLAGNLSPWSRATCTTAIIDDASPMVRASRQWQRFTAAGFHDHTYRITRTRGATLTLRDIDARSIAIRAEQCKGCGAIAVRFSGHGFTAAATLSVNAVTSRDRTFTVLRLKGDHQGTLRITVTSAGRPVEVDAVGYTRDLP